MKDLLIDLDNTIYCEDSKIFSQIDFKMKTFIASKLQLSLEEAYLIQKKYFKKYGTTLRGLMLNDDIEPEYFLKYVHDIDLTSLKKNTSLKKQMSKFSGKKIIFTNGTFCHAERVLKKVGVLEEVDEIFDIKAAKYIPKPNLKTYKEVINKFNLIFHNTIMIDDIPANLKTAKELGTKTILIDIECNKTINNFVDFTFRNLESFMKKINKKDIFNENRKT